MANFAFVLILLGVLLVYGEFIWVGRLFCGVTGSLTALAGVALLARLPCTAFGICFIGLAVASYLLEARFQTRCVAGLAGSLFMGFGFWRITDAGQRVNASLAFPASLIFGVVTVSLLTLSKRARQNKHVL